MNKVCGIYKIVCISNGKIYIGSSLNIGKRWSYHIQDLTRGNHKNTYLQNAWNLYGSKCFEFSIIEEISEPLLVIEREQYWLDFYKSYDNTIGFNVCPVAQSQLGHRWTDEQKQAQSKRLKGNIVSEEAKHKISLAGQGRSKVLNEEIVLQIIDLNNKGKSIKEICNAFSLKHSTVLAILTRQNWKHLTKNLEIIHNRKSGLSGFSHSKCKLFQEDINVILEMLNNNISVKEIALKFNVTLSSIYRIKNGKINYGILDL